MTEKVLVVDDDPIITRTLRINLHARGWEVETVTNGRDALQSIQDAPPALVILDLGLPDMDGVDVLRHIRLSSQLPVIVLSARRESDDKVEALDCGADDYVVKPFGMDELMARVRVGLRRSAADGAVGGLGGAGGLGSLGWDVKVPTLETPDFTLNFADHLAFRAGEPLKLTPTEWRLLATLAANLGKVVLQEQLLKSAWGPEYGREANYLRVYANQLRRKLEPDPANPKYLLTEPGIGYRLTLPLL